MHDTVALQGCSPSVMCKPLHAWGCVHPHACNHFANDLGMQCNPHPPALLCKYKTDPPFFGPCWAVLCPTVFDHNQMQHGNSESWDLRQMSMIRLVFPEPTVPASIQVYSEPAWQRARQRAKQRISDGVAGGACALHYYKQRLRVTSAVVSRRRGLRV